ncbi:MAG TPA: hypothetical protein HPP77_10605 [Candidatus Hydrogenedentes bacterium]|nr:hypothetical protein [Candidatus Hydrogenedentota bacterium]
MSDPLNAQLLDDVRVVLKRRIGPVVPTPFGATLEIEDTRLICQNLTKSRATRTGRDVSISLETGETVHLRGTAYRHANLRSLKPRR